MGSPGSHNPSGSRPDATYLHVFLHLFLLVSELAKSVDDQTWEAGHKSEPIPLPTSKLPVSRRPSLALLPKNTETSCLLRAYDEPDT